MVSAVVLEARSVLRTERNQTGRTRLDELFEAAEMIIKLRVSDPDFTVTALADELSVSASYLARAFRRHDTTPKQRMLEARRDRARNISRTEAFTSAPEIAEFAGFSSTRTLRRNTAEPSHDREQERHRA